MSSQIELAGPLEAVLQHGQTDHLAHPVRADPLTAARLFAYLADVCAEGTIGR